MASQCSTLWSGAKSRGLVCGVRLLCCALTDAELDGDSNTAADSATDGSRDKDGHT
jgi:hypothetical protein